MPATLVCLSKAPNTVKHNEMKVIDIVAVHGFSDQNTSVWKTPDGTDWLRDYVPKDIPTSRVFNFKYDPRTLFSGSKEEFEDVAGTLIDQILVVRKQAPSTRPLAFICHGIGGLVVEAALNKTQAKDSKHPGFLDCVKAIIFLGTPQRDSMELQWPALLVNCIRDSMFPGVANSETIQLQIHGWTARNAKFLRRVVVKFKVYAPKIKISSYYEQVPTLPLQECSVNKNHATLECQSEKVIEMPGRNHLSLASFTGRDEDDNYKSVIQTIIEIGEPASTTENPISTSSLKTKNSKSQKVKLADHPDESKNPLAPQSYRRIDEVVTKPEINTPQITHGRSLAGGFQTSVPHVTAPNKQSFKRINKERRLEPLNDKTFLSVPTCSNSTSLGYAKGADRPLQRLVSIEKDIPKGRDQEPRDKEIATTQPKQQMPTKTGNLVSQPSSGHLRPTTSSSIKSLAETPFRKTIKNSQLQNTMNVPQQKPNQPVNTGSQQKLGSLRNIFSSSNPAKYPQPTKLQSSEPARQSNPSLPPAPGPSYHSLPNYSQPGGRSKGQNPQAWSQHQQHQYEQQPMNYTGNHKNQDNRSTNGSRTAYGDTSYDGADRDNQVYLTYNQTQSGNSHTSLLYIAAKENSSSGDESSSGNESSSEEESTGSENDENDTENDDEDDSNDDDDDDNTEDGNENSNSDNEDDDDEDDDDEDDDDEDDDGDDE